MALFDSKVFPAGSHPALVSNAVNNGRDTPANRFLVLFGLQFAPALRIYLIS